MHRRFPRLPLRGLLAGCLAVALAATALAPSAADARRLGGGSSFGRQSTHITPRTATPSPAAPSATPYSGAAAPAAAPSAAAPASAAKPAAASAPAPAPAPATPARSGASRWLGPIAGIAAGLGLAALMSHLGLSGAFAEFLSSALLIAVAVFAVLFIVRRLFGSAPRPALQGAGGPLLRESGPPPAMAPAAMPAAPQAGLALAAPPAEAEPVNWFIPGDFDTAHFLQQAKAQFVNIQALWDTGEVDRLREYLTDDLIAELKPQLGARGGLSDKTEVVLLNAEMLGIEAVSDGHLASVRFSGMLRESLGAEAFRFEEVWNLFKPTQGGWLLAGIQQIPVEQAS
ncbi:MAG TPA: TIM44-like domain-containing protein [Bordetella sp.]